MTSVIDLDEVVGPGGARHIELTGVKLALIGGNGGKRVAHITDSRLGEIDQCTRGNLCENLDRAFGYAGYAGMLVQCNSLLNSMDKVPPEPVNACRDVRDDMFEIESSVGARHHDLA